LLTVLSSKFDPDFGLKTVKKFGRSNQNEPMWLFQGKGQIIPESKSILFGMVLGEEKQIAGL
jgi:hypothetical protein